MQLSDVSVVLPSLDPDEKLDAVIDGLLEYGFTYIGRYIYATGSNSEAARLAGLNTDMVNVAAYIVSACLCGVAGNSLIWMPTREVTISRLHSLQAISPASLPQGKARC